MRWTIQRKLTVWYAGFLLLVLLVFGVVLYQALARSLRAEVARSVTVQAQQIVDALGSSEQDEADESNEDGSHFDIDDPDLIRDYGAPGMYIEIQNNVGSMLNQSPELRGQSLAGGQLESSVGGSTEGTTEIRELPQIGLVLVHSRPLVLGTAAAVTLRVGRSIGFIDDALKQLQFVLLVLTFAGVALAVIVGAILATRALAPIDRITQTARTIGVDDLQQRLRLAGPDDEVTRLGGAFDEMLNRVEDGFLRERRFSSDVAHELRTPLTILKGTAEVALRPGSEDLASCRATLESIEEETDGMIRMVESLLLLSRSDSGHLPLSISQVALPVLCRDVATTFSALADEKGIEFLTDLAEDLTVQADAERIRQLLRNLVSNALSFTPHGGQVTLSLQQDGSHALVTVSDTGIGIPTEHLPHIFERFYRVDQSRSRSRGGAGLGLAIASVIAESHDSRIDVTSREGKGSNFSFRLPLSTHRNTRGEEGSGLPHYG